MSKQQIMDMDMDMEFFINHTDDMNVGILLYQCNPIIGERLSKLEEKGTLVNVYVVGLLSKYNNRLIDKWGVETYINMINEITEYYGGIISNDWIIKKSWMSKKNRMDIFKFECDLKTIL